MRQHSLIIAVLIVTGLFANRQAACAESPVVEWTRQLGTGNVDYGHGVSVDGSGNAYVTGTTGGGLNGNPYAGNYDMFLTKYDSAGVRLWTEQLGTGGYDEGYGVSVDSVGNAYVAGYTSGAIDGNSKKGGYDIFLAKYNTNGNKQWTRQLGNKKDNVGRDVSVDGSGNAYVTGYTFGGLNGNTSAGGKDMFLTKYDTNGARQWTKQLGTGGYDEAFDVSVDSSGNAYVAGAGDNDMFLAKYDTDGAIQWTRQLVTADGSVGDGVSVDGSGNVYVAGYTRSSLDGNTSAGGSDMFLIKYDTNGNRQWTEQLGTDRNDSGYGVSVDSVGNAYVTGLTFGGLDGASNAGEYDMFLVKYESDGAKLWTVQLGTSGSDVGDDVWVDDSGNAYVTGWTVGGLNGNTHAGNSDIFLIKISSIPEPATMAILMLGGIGILRRRKWINSG